MRATSAPRSQISGEGKPQLIGSGVAVLEGGCLVRVPQMSGFGSNGQYRLCNRERFSSKCCRPVGGPS
jgi:hypothetical protein